MFQDVAEKNFIVFEGGEGTGKTTQIRILVQRLERMEFKIMQTREPGGTTCGAKIREILLSKDTEGDPPTGWTEFFLFIADRAQHMNLIKGALQNDSIVISDRFRAATLAYQGYARGLREGNEEAMYAIDRTARQGVLPGLIILFDQPVSIGLLRKAKQGGEEVSRFEEEKISFHEAVRHGFLDIAKHDRFSRWEIIDASQPIEVVSGIIWDIVQDYLQLGQKGT